MTPAIEYGLVFLIVAACAWHLARVGYRSVRRFLGARRGACGGCGTCGAEAPSGPPGRPVQVERIERRG